MPCFSFDKWLWSIPAPGAGRGWGIPDAEVCTRHLAKPFRSTNSWDPCSKPMLVLLISHTAVGRLRFRVGKFPSMPVVTGGGVGTESLWLQSQAVRHSAGVWSLREEGVSRSKDQGVVDAVECSRKVKTTSIPSWYYTFGITSELKCGKRLSTPVWYLPSMLPSARWFWRIRYSGLLPLCHQP